MKSNKLIFVAIVFAIVMLATTFIITDTYLKARPQTCTYKDGDQAYVLPCNEITDMIEARNMEMNKKSVEGCRDYFLNNMYTNLEKLSEKYEDAPVQDETTFEEFKEMIIKEDDFIITIELGCRSDFSIEELEALGFGTEGTVIQ